MSGARSPSSASPMGVIFGLVPRTHPAAMFVFKMLIALKGRNALILSSHRDAQSVTNHTGDLIAEVLTATPPRRARPRLLARGPRD